MTEQEEITKLEKQLEVCQEEIRTRNQIKETFVGFCFVLVQLSISYAVFTLAIIGANTIYPQYWKPLAGTLLLDGFILWIFWGVHFTCYRPIMDDATEGFGKLYKKYKCAVAGWRKS